MRKKKKKKVNQELMKPETTLSLHLEKRLFYAIKRGSKGGRPGQWSARKAQMLARRYKAAGGGYR